MVSAILLVLFWLLIGLLVVLAGVVFTPVKLWIRLRSSPSLGLQVQASVFGGLTPKMSIFDSTRDRQRADNKKIKRTKKKRGGRKTLRGKGLISSVPRFLKDILGVVHLDSLRLDADYGLADPADTGQLFGCLAPFIYAAPLPQRVNVSLRPDFNQARFVGELDSVLHITPGALLPPAFRLAWQIYRPQK